MRRLWVLFGLSLCPVQSLKTDARHENGPLAFTVGPKTARIWGGMRLLGDARGGVAELQVARSPGAKRSGGCKSQVQKTAICHLRSASLRDFVPPATCHSLLYTVVKDLCCAGGNCGDGRLTAVAPLACGFVSVLGSGCQRRHATILPHFCRNEPSIFWQLSPIDNSPDLWYIPRHNRSTNRDDGDE